jgi:hypothetical protein
MSQQGNGLVLPLRLKLPWELLVEIREFKTGRAVSLETVQNSLGVIIIPADNFTNLEEEVACVEAKSRT